MSDKSECVCPECASILDRDDVVESHERLLKAFFIDAKAQGLTVREAMIVGASLAAWMADSIYANLIDPDANTPEAQDRFTQAFVGTVEELLEQPIGIDPDEDEDEPTAAAEDFGDVPENPVAGMYLDAFGGDPGTRH